MDTDFLECFLPNGALDWFEVKNIEKTNDKVRIRLEEKNLVPEIPEEHRGKRIVSKGFTELLIDDFPIRGRKTELLFLRRSWEIEGTGRRLRREIDLCADGTKLEKEFADFLKGFPGDPADFY
jgi:hypothetical protein